MNVEKNNTKDWVDEYNQQLNKMSKELDKIIYDWTNHPKPPKLTFKKWQAKQKNNISKIIHKFNNKTI